MCQETVRKNANKDLFDVVCVTPETLYTYLPDLRRDLHKIIHSNVISDNIAIKADYIRMNLLNKYGGVWVDSDIILIQDLSNIYELLRIYQCVGINSKVTPYAASFGFIGFRQGSVILSQYIKTADARINRSNQFPWTGLSTDIMKPIVKNHMSKCFFFDMHDIGVVGSKNWRIFFTDTDPNTFITSKTIIVYLFNKLFPQSFKAMSRTEVLSKSWLVSRILKKVLGE